MIESMIGMTYGRVQTEIVYKGGVPVTNIQKTTTIIKTPDRKSLLDNIFDQLKQLQDTESVCFKVYADPHTREATRMEVTTETYLV